MYAEASLNVTPQAKVRLSNAELALRHELVGGVVVLHGRADAGRGGRGAAAPRRHLAGEPRVAHQQAVRVRSGGAALGTATLTPDRAVVHVHGLGVVDVRLDDSGGRGNSLFCPSDKQFHAVVLERVRNTCGALRDPPVKFREASFTFFPPPDRCCGAGPAS